MPSSATPGSTDGVGRGVVCPEPRLEGEPVGVGDGVVVGVEVGLVGAVVGVGVTTLS